MVKFVRILLCTSALSAGTGIFAANELPLATGDWPPYTTKSMDKIGYFLKSLPQPLRNLGSRTRLISFLGNVAKL
jgi:hypothetical protein